MKSLAAIRVRIPLDGKVSHMARTGAMTWVMVLERG